MSELPATIERWNPHMKAKVCDEVLAGRLPKADACRAYDLSAEELEAWLQRYVKHGLRGLAVTRLQAVR